MLTEIDYDRETAHFNPILTLFYLQHCDADRVIGHRQHASDQPAADPCTDRAKYSSRSALVQAMASFATPNATDASSAAPFAVDTSQQLNLLTPGHG
ncbi:MAG TPA: hypothetical protein VFI58_00640 [Xanthobacteraceae bacterium]|nr:hypothetical protein [Xanthobacteraceae bacterium]